MSFDVAVTIARGERHIACAFATGGGVTALCGPSGVGKSSVLAAVAGLVSPVAGHVRVGGVTLFDAGAGIDLPPEARACGLVFQDLRLFPHMNVAANLRYGARRARDGAALIGFDEAVRLLGIAPLLGRRPATLSGGEAQRVAIGRALLSGPRFLLLDEPLAALDAARRDGIITVIERIRADLALPMILVSHSAADVARLADQVVTIEALSD